MEVPKSVLVLMLVILWSITTFTGYARLLVVNDMGESSDTVKYSNPIAPEFMSKSTNKGKSSYMVNSNPIAPDFIFKSTNNMVNSNPIAPDFVSTTSTYMGESSDTSNSNPIAPELVSGYTSYVISPAYPEFVHKSATSAEPDPGRIN